MLLIDLQNTVQMSLFLNEVPSLRYFIVAIKDKDQGTESNSHLPILQWETLEVKVIVT
jgi:hypothetical protein